MKPPLLDRVLGEDLDPAALPESDVAFLRVLGGPTLLRMPGRDATRTRVVSTLLHGNEPSGVRAVLRYLRSGDRPATNALFFIGAVGTALEPPGFAWRALPGQPDANRCWRPPWETDEGRIAYDVLDRIRGVAPECLVDLHNNTGHNPAYGVAFSIGHAERSLVSLFADRVVHTPLELGTLVEATLPICASVTIECGRAGDPVADEAAWQGLRRLLDWDVIDFERPVQPLAVYEDPVRVCLGPGATLAFAETPNEAVTLTVSGSIDRHNFDCLPPGTPIGWVDGSGTWPLEAWDADGRECSRSLFAVDDGVLRTARERVPIMMTTDRIVAMSDCLFYSVRLA